MKGAAVRHKVKAVKLSQLLGVLVEDVAASLDIHPFMLSKWCKKVRDSALSAEDEVIIELHSAAELRLLAADRERARMFQAGA